MAYQPLDTKTANLLDSEHLLGILTSYARRHWGYDYFMLFETHTFTSMVGASIQVKRESCEIYITESEDDPDVFELYFYDDSGLDSDEYDEDYKPRDLLFELDIEDFEDITDDMLTELFAIASEKDFILVREEY